ncbi:MAG: FAD-dependent oxidoreductase, partial [Armatimonadota bacterium]
MRTTVILLVFSLAFPAAGQVHQVPAAKLAEVDPSYDYDVAVVGGGPSGVAASIAAAREGAKTLLIEQYAFLGGMGTAASVNVFMDYKHAGGIFREMFRRVSEAGGMRGST